MIRNNKKGAEESNLIIFIILALIVVGLVIWFTYGFFSTGTRLIDGNDPSVAIALESCRYEIARQPDAYCNSAKSVKIKKGGNMIVSCYFLDNTVRKDSFESIQGKPNCPSNNQQFKESQCNLIKDSGVSDADWKKTIVDGDKCDDVLKGINIEKERQIVLTQGQIQRVQVNDKNHGITPLNINSDSAKIEIKGNPIIIELKVGEERKIDLNSDGNYNLYTKLESVSQGKITLSVKEINEKAPEVQEQQNGIQEFKGSGNFKVLSYEECVSGLEQRKKELGIPDKLCYWKAMTEVYDDKCENLNKQQVSEIFEKKEEYRRLNNPDWPSLNTDGDFCVDVIYDCHEWKIYTTPDSETFGFNNPAENHAFYSGLSRGIHINPYRALSKGLVWNTILLHEGLHSIQTMFGEVTHLAGGDDFSGGSLEQYSTISSLASHFKAKEKNYNEIKPQLDIILSKINLEKERVRSERSLLSSINEKSPEDSAKIRELTEKFIDLSKVYSYARTPLSRVFVPEQLERDYSENVKDVLDSYGIFNEELQKAYNSILKINRESYILTIEHRTKGYVGSKIELDPRLSEVQRWWLEKTAPNCTIILTQEKAREVLDLFLVETNLPDEYKWSQQDLGLLLYVYRGTEYEEDVYNDLIGRLPGLASTTQPPQDYAYA